MEGSERMGYDTVKNHMWRGIDVVKKLLDGYNENILVYFDPDVDGMISGYFICKFLSGKGKRYSWYVNSNRSHDWSIPIEKIKGYNIVAVDFMINRETVKSLVYAGCNLVSIDHHINQPAQIRINHGGKTGIVINNQYPFEDEDGRYLSGAGVVFETLIEIDKSFDTEENRALVGLTLLSDVCNIENPLAKEYLRVLYNHKLKGYVKYLIDNTIGDKDFVFGVPRLDRKYVDYKFSPAINSCLRFNREDDVVRFFLGSGKLDLTYHKRQKKLVQDMLDVANVREFPHLRVVFIREEDVLTNEDTEVLSNFIGLLASRFLDGTHSVIAYLVSTVKDGETGEVKRFIKRASFRGAVNGVDYLSVLNEEKVLRGVGHPSAFGVLEVVPTKGNFLKISEICGKCEGVYTNTITIIPVSNLSLFSNQKGKQIAEHNIYCLSQNSKYIRYIGNNIKVTKQGTGYIKYKVDGIEVTAFDLKVNFSNGLIYPVIERGYLYYYLQAEDKC